VYKEGGTMNIYVGNLSYELTEEELQEAFQAYGRVDSAKIIKDMYSGRSRGFGFVEMSDKEEGEAAVKGLNGKELKGRPIRVNEARPRSGGGRRHGGGGGGGGGFRRGGGGNRNYNY
jgi:RNA recognition motif-containing protein